jgi:hypothetical protein
LEEQGGAGLVEGKSGAEDEEFTMSSDRTLASAVDVTLKDVAG